MRHGAASRSARNPAEGQGLARVGRGGIDKAGTSQGQAMAAHHAPRDPDSAAISSHCCKRAPIVFFIAQTQLQAQAESGMQ
jgi:hypothetical protein